MNINDKASLAQDAKPFVQLPMVYIKAVNATDVQGLQGVPPEAKLYGIFSAEGAPIAVLGDRNAAFYAARENNMFPVSLH